MIKFLVAILENNVNGSDVYFVTYMFLFLDLKAQKHNISDLTEFGTIIDRCKQVLSTERVCSMFILEED